MNDVKLPHVHFHFCHEILLLPEKQHTFASSRKSKSSEKHDSKKKLNGLLRLYIRSTLFLNCKGHTVQRRCCKSECAGLRYTISTDVTPQLSPFPEKNSI